MVKFYSQEEEVLDRPIPEEEPETPTEDISEEEEEKVEEIPEEKEEV